MRDIPAIQICREALFFFSANHIPLEGYSEKRGERGREMQREGVCVGRGVQREMLWGELRGPLAAALRVIDKSEEVM